MPAVGFRIAGHYPRPTDPGAGETFLDRCEAFFTALPGPYPINCIVGHDPEERTTLFVHIHPAAEPMFITDLGDDDDDDDDAPSGPGKPAGHFLAWANTTAIGPAYHAHACELFHDLVARLDLTLAPPGTMTDQGRTGDPTTYFHTRDRAALERAHLDALVALCRRLIPICQAAPNQQVTLSLPSGVIFESEEPVQTLLGPRPLSWAIDLVAAADAQDAAAAASLAASVSPWFHPGQRARYHLGRALHRMWCDVHWNTPKFEPDRGATLEVLHALDAAYREDPTLDYPWREWHMLINHARLIDHPAPPYEREILRRAGLIMRDPTPHPFIGYRLGEVCYRVGDWRVRLPGDFVKRPRLRDVPDIDFDALDLDELQATVAALTVAAGFAADHPDDRVVHVWTQALDREFAHGDDGVDRYLATRNPPAGRAAIGRYEHQVGAAKGVAFLYKEPPNPPEAHPDAPPPLAYTFVGMTAVPGQFAVASIHFNDREDHEVAEHIWRSIDPWQGD